MEINKLRTLQLDALKEAANTGAAHAATALSELIGQKVMIKVPVVEINTGHRTLNVVAQSNETITGVVNKFMGDITGLTVWLLPENNARDLYDLCLQHMPEDRRSLATKRGSLMKEVAKYLTEAYLNTLGNMLGMVIVPKVPVLVNGEASDVVDIVLFEYGLENNFVVCIENEFEFASKTLPMKGMFLMLPDFDSLKKILETFNLE